MYIISGAGFLFVIGTLASNTQSFSVIGSDHFVELFSKPLYDSFSSLEM